MSVYADTSFLCALYRHQDNTGRAVALRISIRDPLPVTALVLFEFRNSVRLQTWLHRGDSGKGYGNREGSLMLASLQGDLDAGLLQVEAVEWARVIGKAEELSARHTGEHGHRAFDTLHVATALELGAKEFLTFDARQTILAKAAGLKVKS